MSLIGHFRYFDNKKLYIMESKPKSSFRKKGEAKSNLIRGTKPSLHNSQLLISSGVPSLDSLLGGGIPVGSLVLINEDEYGAYAKFILKYFLAEGIMSHHALFVCSQDTDPEEMVKELPSPVDADLEDENHGSENDKKMTIAWRYENLKTTTSYAGHKHFGHYFDLSKTMNEETIKNSNITYWEKTEGTCSESFQDSSYSNVLVSLKKVLKEGNYFANQSVSERNILRIGLHKLNSPFWQYDSNNETTNSVYLLTFLYSLRALIRNAFATCVVTLPFSKFKKNLINKCIHFSDIAIQLQSFAGTKCENVTPYKDYHGFFIIQKLAAINSMTAFNPQVSNLAFKLRRKKLVIEEFSLPPELEDSTEREQDDSSVLTCSSSKSKKLEF